MIRQTEEDCSAVEAGFASPSLLPGPLDHLVEALHLAIARDRHRQAAGSGQGFATDHATADLTQDQGF